MSRSDRATVLKINSVGAVGAQVAPGRVVVAHCAEDHEQLAHAGSEPANTRVGQAPATDVGTTGREMLAAHGHHRLRSPHARPSQRRTPFPTFRHSCGPSVIPAAPPSFLRRQESRRSVRVKGTPNVRRRPITRGALVGRRPDGGSSHGWAVAWIPASAGMTDRAGVMAAHGHHRLRSPHARPSQRRAPFPTFRLSCAPSVIPAEAGIQAICAGQGHSQCSTAPDHPRGSGGPSAGWRLVARLGGRMDSCLRRNDGQGGCDGGGGGTTEGRWDPTCSEDAGQRPPRVETALNVERAPPRPRIAARRRRRSAAPRSRGCASGPPATDRG